MGRETAAAADSLSYVDQYAVHYMSGHGSALSRDYQSYIDQYASGQMGGRQNVTGASYRNCLEHAGSFPHDGEAFASTAPLPVPAGQHRLLFCCVGIFPTHSNTPVAPVAQRVASVLVGVGLAMAAAVASATGPVPPSLICPPLTLRSTSLLPPSRERRRRSAMASTLSLSRGQLAALGGHG